MSPITLNQIIVTIIVFLGVVALMGLGMLISGKPMRRSCGGVGGDESECMICDPEEKPEDCPYK